MKLAVAAIILRWANRRLVSRVSPCEMFVLVMRLLPCLLLVFAVFSGGVSLRAQGDSAVPLPPFIVEEASKGPPWRYAEMPGFEVLSRCPDRTTRDLAAAHWRLHRLLELLLPERLQLTFALPKAMIFYDESLQSAASQEVISSMLKRSARDAAPVDLQDMMGRRGLRGTALPAPRLNFLPNLRLWDRDAMMVFAIVRDGGYDADRLALTADYVNYLLLNRVPALPWWFVTGVLKLYEHVEYDSNSLALDPITWLSDDDTSALKRDPKTAPGPLPLAEFFNSLPPLHPATPEEELRRKIWVSQGALVVRWVLDAHPPEQREKLWDLVGLGAGAITAATFQASLGIDFATADAQLAAYLPTAVRKALTLKPAKPLKAPVLALRDATDVELARIKGDWERLEVGFVKKNTPELADKYLEQARRTLRRPYDRDVREPRLLAALGLCECDAGDDRAARDFLESAARVGALRPRAAYELARLRFAEAAASPDEADGKLSTSQVAKIFTPLFAVREQAPPLPEVYELIAHVWARSVYRPTRGHLAVLDEGVRLFPRRSELVYQTAALYAHNGLDAESADLVKLGLLVAPAGTDHDRFAQLAAQLAAAPPAAK